MKPGLYLVLAALGLTVPYWFFINYLIAHGFELTEIVQDLFANEVSTFFALDLVIATLVFWYLVISETRRLAMKFSGLYILAAVTIGLSFALPLFLYFRERKQDSAKSTILNQQPTI